MGTTESVRLPAREVVVGDFIDDGEFAGEVTDVRHVHPGLISLRLSNGKPYSRLHVHEGRQFKVWR